MDPSHIMQVGLGFWASKTLLSAVELELFTLLARGPLTASGIAQALTLHQRAVPDFPDALVALRFLAREGDGAAAVYSNTPESALFLDKKSPAYIGGILEMANARLYGFWADLTPALKTGAPQNETKNGGESMFAKLYEVPERPGNLRASWRRRTRTSSACRSTCRRSNPLPGDGSRRRDCHGESTPRPGTSSSTCSRRPT
jgi:hypothetical protein